MYRCIKPWSLPPCYIGEHWSDWYVILGRTRDSNLVDVSNFDVMLSRLGGERENVRVVRESHWAVGWIEWIGVHKSETETLILADALRAKMDDYPLLDEEDHTRRVWEQAQRIWDNMDREDRRSLVKREGDDTRHSRIKYLSTLYRRAERTAHRLEEYAQE